MKIAYPNLVSARRLVPHDGSMPAPLPPNHGLTALADEVEEDFVEGRTLGTRDSIESEYDAEKCFKSILFFQERLNDLIKDLALSNKMHNCLHRDC